MQFEKTKHSNSIMFRISNSIMFRTNRETLEMPVFHDNRSSMNLVMEIYEHSFLTHIMSKPPAGCQSADAAQHAVSHLYKINTDLPNRNLVKMSSRASPDNPCNINHQTVKGTVFQPEKHL